MRRPILDEVAQEPEGCLSIFFLHEEAVKRGKELLWVVSF